MISRVSSKVAKSADDTKLFRMVGTNTDCAELKDSQRASVAQCQEEQSVAGTKLQLRIYADLVRPDCDEPGKSLGWGRGGHHPNESINPVSQPCPVLCPEGRT